MVSTMGIETAIIGSSLLGATQARKAGKRAEKAAEKEAAATLQASREAQALNEQRYADTLSRMRPYMQGAETGYGQLLTEMGLADGESLYMDSPYATGIEEAYAVDPNMMQMIEEAGLDAATYGLAGRGEAYGGTRFRELADIGARNKLAALQYQQGQRQQKYGAQQTALSNYMNTLQNIANPQVAQNVSSLGLGQAANIGAQNIAAQQGASDLRLSGMMSNQQGQTEALGMGMDLFGDAMRGGYI